jgi:hypothetical protein
MASDATLRQAIARMHRHRFISPTPLLKVRA